MDAYKLTINIDPNIKHYGVSIKFRNEEQAGQVAEMFTNEFAIYDHYQCNWDKLRTAGASTLYFNSVRTVTDFCSYIKDRFNKSIELTKIGIEARVGGFVFTFDGDVNEL